MHLKPSRSPNPPRARLLLNNVTESPSTCPLSLSLPSTNLTYLNNLSQLLTFWNKAERKQLKLHTTSLWHMSSVLKELILLPAPIIHSFIYSLIHSLIKHERSPSCQRYVQTQRWTKGYVWIQSTIVQSEINTNINSSTVWKSLYEFYTGCQGSPEVRRLTYCGLQGRGMVRGSSTVNNT